MGMSTDYPIDVTLRMGAYYHIVTTLAPKKMMKVVYLGARDEFVLFASMSRDTVYQFPISGYQKVWEAWETSR